MDKKSQGKKNRAAGLRFEHKVRKDLESKGWIVSKWQNNVELAKSDKYNVYKVDENMTIPDGEGIPGKCVPAKPGRFRMMQTGFPDFIAYKQPYITNELGINLWNAPMSAIVEPEYLKPFCIIFIECKSNGYLKPEEKEKANWYLKNNYCSKFLIAKKGEKRGEILYVEWKPY